MITIPLPAKKIFFIILCLLFLTPFLSAPIALLSGFLFTNLFGNPFDSLSKKTVKWLLKASVVGLGFGMFLQKTIETGKDGLILTVITIVLTITLGVLLGKLLKIDKAIAYLISTGTSICGGSAIAAVSSVINAKDKQISIALGVVFFLNALAIFIFPALGNLLELSQHEFGIWSAIAIHDTSSVVGAAMAYGEEALDTAITVKLARALWIIPVSLISMFIYKSDNGKIKIPWFIFLFILAILANSFLDLPSFITSYVPAISKQLLVLTLFLVGTGLSIKTIKSTGFMPILLGVLLWITISVISLLYILNFS
ncbi:putative integral membrane protein (TIGR00698 family) [Mesonia hippocampi]|uniref:Putative integral membrane protein (TIGR00698 family) n=1 Tax=Mesonia hippocampi TaxID=1628250 RepID=A0A840ELV2_9FLAO|nr:putative sulfate exporter family transporter [Mesonia hippocampi]MBB4118071.1 putative integral membrane protein (TIGR00698 family) [Mesonia hippocampi]